MTTSAIFKLHNDTLLSIFDTITLQIPNNLTLQEARPLITVSAASQVCQEWRALLLASPWIWGRLVDLDVESDPHTPQNVKWLEEVVRRTGDSAPLWIYGRVPECSWDAMNLSVGANLLGVQTCFMRLLDSWERIERLSVHIELEDKKTRSCIQNRFACRAPILKSFDVRLDRPLFRDTLRPESSQRLFADYAPSLRAMKADQVAYRLDSPWLSNIREIDPLPEKITLQDLFILLQHTPMIETIGIYSKNLSMPEPALPSFANLERIVLRNLSSMKLRSNLPGFAAFLDHVSPGNLSTLVLKVSDFQTEDLNDAFILSSIKVNLPFYLSSYYSTNTFSKYVELSMLRASFGLYNITDGVRGYAVQNLEVEMDLLLSHHDWNKIVASLLDAFTQVLSGNPSAVEPVTELRLPFLNVPPTLIPKLSTTLALFTYVEHIQTDEHALQALSSLDQYVYGENSNEHKRVLFLGLHTLRLTTFTSGTACCADLLQFLMMRRNVGFPIARLDLTRCFTTSRYTYALGNLEAVQGLEVIWRNGGETRKRCEEDEEICSYICGTGDPDQLKNLTFA